MHYTKPSVMFYVFIATAWCKGHTQSRGSARSDLKMRKFHPASSQPNIALTITEKGLAALAHALPLYFKTFLLQYPLTDKYGIQFGRRYANVLRSNITAIGNETVLSTALMEPNFVSLNIEKGSMTQQSFIQFYDGRNGKSTTEMQQLQGSLVASLAANQRGMLTAKLEGCSLSVGKVKITYTSENGKVTVINPTRIGRQMKNSINAYICDDASRAISFLDAKLQSMFKENEMVKTTSGMPSSLLFISRMLHNMQSSKANAATRRAKKLRYVQRLFDSPKFTFTPQSASFPFVGTFCDRQHCHLGPNRAAVPGSVKVHDKMINLYVSDYTAQTFLQSIFDIGLLNMSFAGKSFGKWKNIFRQSCSQNICLGSILPSWVSAYPNEEIELDVYYTEAPVLQYKPGKAVLLNEMVVAMYSRPPNGHFHKILQVALSARLHFSIVPKSGRMLNVKPEVVDATVKVLENQVKAKDEELKQLENGIRQAILTPFQLLLANGFELRASCVVIENLQVELYQGFIFLAFDFVPNDQCVIKKLTDAAKQ